MEKKEENKEAEQLFENADADDDLDNFIPDVQEKGFCQLWISSFKLHFQSSLLSGYACGFILAVLGFVLAGALSLFTLRNLNVPVNYTDMASIYSTVEPLDVYFNNNVESGIVTTSTDFMNSLSAAAGEGVLTLNGQDWQAKDES